MCPHVSGALITGQSENWSPAGSLWLIIISSTSSSNLKTDCVSLGSVCICSNTSYTTAGALSVSLMCTIHALFSVGTCTVIMHVNVCPVSLIQLFLFSDCHSFQMPDYLFLWSHRTTEPVFNKWTFIRNTPGLFTSYHIRRVCISINRKMGHVYGLFAWNRQAEPGSDAGVCEIFIERYCDWRQRKPQRL